MPRPNAYYSSVTDQKYCGFCNSCGINAPHDHALRDEKTKIITCPKLKDTTCQHCLEKGHTKLYCKNRKRESDYYNGDVDEAGSSTKVGLTINVNAANAANTWNCTVPIKRNREYYSSNHANKKKLAQSAANSVDNFLVCSFAGLEVEDIDIDKSPTIEEQMGDVSIESRQKTKEEKIQELRDKLGTKNLKTEQCDWFLNEEDDMWG